MNMGNNLETVSPTGASGVDDFQPEMRQRRPPLDHASQLGAISDVTDEEEER
jgi:hypothetical protein